MMKNWQTPNGLHLRPLDDSHNQAMLDILAECPIETAGLSICFDRKPNVFTMANLKYNPAWYVGLFADDILQGFALLGFHPAYVNHRITPVFHLTDYYVRPKYRHFGNLFTVMEYYLSFAELPARCGYGIVMRGNRPAQHYVDQKPQQLKPKVTWKRIGQLDACTMVLTRKKVLPKHPMIRPARLEDIDDIVKLLQTEHQNRLFGQIYERDTFATNLTKRPGLGLEHYVVAVNGTKLVGIAAAWDTQAFKQNRVYRYGPALQLTRLAYTVLTPLFGMTPLPKPGQAFRDLHVIDWAAAERSPEILAALLHEIYNQALQNKYHSLILSSCVGDPILAATRPFLTTHVVSSIVFGSLDSKGADTLDDCAALPYIDIALL